MVNDTEVWVHWKGARTGPYTNAEIDALKKEIIGELIMLQPKNESEMKQIYRYLSICKDLERLGDHITTICEWVIFTISGEIVDLNRTAKTAD